MKCRLRQVFGVLIFVVFGCASAQSSSDDAVPLASWKGKTRQELVAALGPPKHETQASNGTTLLTWEQLHRHASGIGRMSRAESYYTVCIREFQIDAEGRIVAASEQGCQ
jgi:hypothetical protein